MPARVPEMKNGEKPYTNGTYHELADDVIISGISGRMPESETIEEFWSNLFNGVDMVNDEETRWPAGTYGLPLRMGKLKHIEKFDATFFGVHSKQADKMDPQLRFLLEVAFEAIVDAGVNPLEIRGSRTGVFVGMSAGETEDYWTSSVDRVNGYGLLGCQRSMLANRLSFFFDFTGPSFTLDTACSSSMIALTQAVQSIKSGACDAAIVGGVNIVLRPTSTLQFKSLNMICPDGKCKAFDASGNGYVRSESVAALYLQRKKDSRRIYATIVHIKSNTDGYKELGITYPSGHMQQQLIEEVYSEAGVDPSEVTYLEAHGTGTKVGDPQEINSITEVFCKGRKEPLLIGSVKSNMGHSEPGSGICSIAKVLLAMEKGYIPANLHFKTPNPEIPALCDGRLKVVDKNTPWDGGYVGINSFGFGGANVHLLLKSHSVKKVETPVDSIPRLISVSGRTYDAVKNYIEKINKMPVWDNNFLSLIQKIHKHNISGHLFRGCSVLGNEMMTNIEEQLPEKRPVWFVFSGMGSQWVGMGRDLMRLEIFSKSINKSHTVLSPLGIDLLHLINSSTNVDFDDNLLNTFVSIAAVQVALVDCLNALGVVPDGIVGHSVGELGCAYADGAFTLEQTILAAYWRGRCVVDAKHIPGAMAAVGLSWEETMARKPEEIIAACHNGPDSVTISGPVQLVNEFIDKLKSEDIFAKKVNSNGIAFHSKYIAHTGENLRASLEKVIPNPKKRSSRWVSTSIPSSRWNEPLAMYSSADYHVNNLLSPVLFHSGISHIPESALVIEIAPHALLQAILKRSLPKSCMNIGLVKRETGLDFFLSNIGRLYNAGLNPNLECIYPLVSFPVPKGTPMIAPLIEWDHSLDWGIADFLSSSGGTGESIITVDVNSDDDKYIVGHTIDGRVLFPATGYMTLVWKTFAKLNQKSYDEMPVILKNVHFRRATIMPKEGTVKFLVNIFDGSGEFEIVESGAVVVTGTIQKATDLKQLDLPPAKIIKDHLPLNEQHIYRDLRLRGYDYSGLFRAIKVSDNLGVLGELDWRSNWVSFMDTMLQFSLIGTDQKELYLPTRIQRVLIDPTKHLNLVSSLPEGSGVPVQMDKYTGVIQSGGMEIRGMKASIAPRRQQTQPPPKLEKYSFVPYNPAKNMDSQLGLTVMLHTVLENSGGVTLLKIAELSAQTLPENLYAPRVVQALESEPKLEVDMTVLATDNIEGLTAVADTLGGKVVKTDLTNEPLSSKVHCIVTGDLNLSNSRQIKNIKDSLHPGGFLLIESKDYPAVETYGFVSVSKIMTDLKILHLFRMEMTKNTQRIVSVTQMNFKWLDEVKDAMKNNDASSDVLLVSEGEPDCGIVGLFNCLKQEPSGESLRCVFIMDQLKEKFSMKSPLFENQLKKGLLMNIMKEGQWGSMRHLPMSKSEGDEFFKVEHAYINTLNRGDLASLHWFEGPLSFYRPENHKGLDLCTIYYATLNFRDIMLATGKLPPDALPGDLAGQDCILGFEFSGRDLSGSRVMGIVTSKALATSVVADPMFLWKVPESWTLEQAATVPVVYATSYYALIVRGRMKKGESVLIHAGSGGVGQAAISIALHMGCKVFTTVGTQQKRDFLKKAFPQLTDNQIGNSRDASFEQLILRETKGKGVDLVLNSLADELLQASIRCLGKEGRFLEIGKYDLSNNTPMGMSVLLKNTAIHGILIDAMFEDGFSRSEQMEIVDLVNAGIASGAVKPLPATTFSINQIEQSFRFMATGKHIGKVLLKIRDEEPIKGKVTPKQQLIPAIPKSYMDPDKSYILVGGLGGFGLELANWMIQRGARYLVLVSRSGVTQGYQSLCLRRWAEKTNCKVKVSTQDSTTVEGAKKLINEAASLAPVGGIFNLAAVLRDGIMENQTVANFEISCRSKVATTKALDEASRVLCGQLDYFVTFSSVSCGRGNAGQSNYGMANSAMERICEIRQSMGLPGVAIQWGAIGDVGLIIDELGGSNETVVGGTLPQRITSCLSAIDGFLQRPNPVVASTVLAEKNRKSASDSNICLADAIANVLGIKDVKTVNPNSTLGDLGMDSLMGAEIKQTLERNYDMALSAKDIRNLTFAKLATLGQSAEGNKPAVNGSEKMSKSIPASKDKLVEFSSGRLVPEETLVKMKSDSTSSRKIFLVHPIEGDVSCLQSVADNLAGTVYGFQATADVPSKSLPEMAAHYIKIMKSVQSRGPYNLVGYSFGACLAFEMSLQLEKSHDRVNIAMLDGSPEFLQNFITKRREKGFRDFDIDHSDALIYFASLFSSNIDFFKMEEEFKKMKDGAATRLKTVASRLAEETEFSVSELETAADLYYNKLAASRDYSAPGKLQSNPVLIKAKDSQLLDSADYGLSKMCSKKVSIHNVEGDHRSFLNGESAKSIAHILEANMFAH